MAAAKTWWVLIPAGDAGKPVSYLESVDFRTQIQPSDPNYKLLQDHKPINAFGMQMVAWKGPFATEAEAKTAQNPKPSPTPQQNIQADVIGPVEDTAQAIGKVGAVLEALLHGDTWRSLGWLLLGVALMVMGVRMWAGKSPIPAPPSVVPVPL